MKQNPNIIFLIRVSGDRQDVARQRTDMERLRKKFPGINIVRILELQGVSGTATLDDKQVREVLESLKLPEIDGIGLSSLDRLFRPGKRYKPWIMLDDFVETGKAMWVVREGYVDPADDEGYEKCSAAFSHAGSEWRKIRQRSMDGKAEKFAEGRIVEAKPPYGYRYIPKHPWNRDTCATHPVREIEPEKCGQFFELGDPFKLEVVSRVFLERSLPTPFYKIAAALNLEGIPSERGGKWSRQTLIQMVEHTVYNGRFISKTGEVIPCPKWIDDDLWNKCQEVNGDRQWIGRPSDTYLLRNFLWCAHCDHRYRGVKSGGGGRFYRCGYTTNFPPKRYICAEPSVQMESFDDAVFECLWPILTDADRLLKVGRKYYDSLTLPGAKGIEKLEKEARRLAEDQRRVVEMTRAHMYSVAEGKLEQKRLQDRIAEIERELKAAGKVMTLPSKQAVEAALREIQTSEKPETYAERRPILEALMDLKVVYKGGTAVISGKVPVPVSSAQKRTGSIDSQYISRLPIPFEMSCPVHVGRTQAEWTARALKSWATRRRNQEERAA